MNIIFHDTDQWTHPDISAEYDMDFEEFERKGQEFGRAVREARERELLALMKGAEE